MSELQSKTQANSVNLTAEQKALSLLRTVKTRLNMSRIDVTGVFLGVETKIHYPKLIDDNGNKIKEIVNGRERDKRSSTSDGWAHYFNELGTGKIIQIVLPEKKVLKVFGLYALSGLGYDMKSSNTYFIEKDTDLKQI